MEKVIFFDIDDTLINHTKAKHNALVEFAERYYKILKFDKTNFIKMWDIKSEKFIKEFFDNNISYQEHRRQILNAVLCKKLSNEKLDVIYNEFLYLYEINWTLFDDVLPTLKKLNKNYILGIISNGSTTQQKKKLENTNIIQYFEYIIISEEIKVAKPNKKIFKYAFDLVNKNNTKCYYVGDNYSTDIEGANNVNCTGLWIKRDNTVIDKSYAYTISSLSQIEKII